MKKAIPYISVILLGLGAFMVFLSFRSQKASLPAKKQDAYKVLEGYLKDFIKNAQSGEIGQDYADLIRENAAAQEISFEGAAAQAWIYLTQEKGAMVDGEEVPREVYNALYMDYVK
jgi:hypothetical protein